MEIHHHHKKDILLMEEAPVDMENIPCSFQGFYTFQVVQDVFHQQYHIEISTLDFG